MADTFTFAEETEAGLALSVTPPDTPDYVIAELSYDSRVSYSARGFQGPSEAEPAVGSLNRIIEDVPTTRFESHLEAEPSSIRKRAALAPRSLDQLRAAERSGFAHGGFVQIVPKRGNDAWPLAERLNRTEAVWKAFVAPRPIPAVATGASRESRNFEPSQGYLHAPPNGIGAIEVWGRRGAKGRGVTICDIEGNWNRSHEDLPRGIRSLGGTPIDDLGWRNHGTAVLGEMVGQPNRFGAVGIAHEARAVVQSAVIRNVFNTARAITNAARRLRAGDAILIELQATGPRGRFVAMQFWDDVYSAIVAAVARGITVVEAAGNGGEDFDRAAYRGSGLQKDSGAILVGAGIPPTNHLDIEGGYESLGAPRSRIWFSNHGRMVNLQAWGWHVTTLGYGDAQGGRENRWHTVRFSGTSSASPIVTGAVACLQGHARARRGRPLSPQRVRRLLVRTGTPQEAGPGRPSSQHIGPQPNLPAAIRRVR